MKLTHVSSLSASPTTAVAQSIKHWPNLRNSTVIRTQPFMNLKASIKHVFCHICLKECLWNWAIIEMILLLDWESLGHWAVFFTNLTKHFSLNLCTSLIVLIECYWFTSARFLLKKSIHGRKSNFTPCSNAKSRMCQSLKLGLWRKNDVNKFCYPKNKQVKVPGW